MKHYLFVFIIFMATSQLTLAGQCNYMNKSQALKALEILEKSKDEFDLFVIDKYCESCLDAYPKPILVNSFAIKKHKQPNIYELSINTKTIDAAYTYVDGNNLANMVGCKTVAVSKYLE